MCTYPYKVFKKIYISSFLIYKITNKIVCIQDLLREDEKNEEKQIQKERGTSFCLKSFFFFL
jgi:hypothetical protein